MKLSGNLRICTSGGGDFYINANKKGDIAIYDTLANVKKRMTSPVVLVRCISTSSNFYN